MTLRATDIKDEHGWQLVDEAGKIQAHASSRDKARAYARGEQGVEVIMTSNGSVPPAAIDTRTPEELEAAAAHEIHLRITSTLQQMRGLWVSLAGDLYLFKRGKLWEKLGYETFASYIAETTDIDFEPRYAYKLVEAWEQLVIEKGVSPERLRDLPVTKVQAVLPAVRRDQVSVDEALSDVEVLGRRDLDLKYSGRASSTPGRPDTSSKIETDREPQYMQCPTCGSRVERERVEGQP